MNKIYKKPLAELGFQFVSGDYLQQGADEFVFRDQKVDKSIFRPLSIREINILESNLNEAENWKDIFVKEGFNAHLVKNCRFFGINRIGKLENCFLEFKNLRMPVGLYNSTIISCDFADNVAIDRVNMLSHYQVGNEVMILQVNELATTATAKFGNGSVKKGEEEKIRIWLELGNENGGRKVIPFLQMKPGDAYLWTRNRDDKALQEKYIEMTLKEFSSERGFYGQIGDRTVIKNTGIIKDVNMGPDTYIKGANKLKNLSILSVPEAPSQIGEGCELVNGIIHEGCRIFYGVKAVRFILAAHSQLKYGARLINSYLGSNSTISCCEVLNALIYPAHEQHHNNSFLCAAVVQGQSNMAAGATLGSNHNSRGADGELQAGRGFWPGLSVALKHNSKFASFNLISKGNYPAEIHNPIPFSLIGNDDKTGGLLIIPAYWFLYNMYAIARNAWKFEARDQRLVKDDLLEFDYLAPDTVFELLNAINLFEKWAGQEWLNDPKNANENLELYVDGIENSKKKTKIAKVYKAYHAFKDILYYHAAKELLATMERNQSKDPILLLKETISKSTPIVDWENVGGQLIPKSALQELKNNIKSGKVNSWLQVHQFYQAQAKLYPDQKFENALNGLIQVLGKKELYEKETFTAWLNKAIIVSQNLADGIKNSRKKDFQDPFRLAMFGNEEEMKKVIGDWKSNDFILQAEKANKEFVEKLWKIFKG
ncbi:DUF4954 family protein [Sandaracinomonas limnophila]|uniref:DUF4954 family protein n=1 Tax=Sandaracinomonas limnophila TaxID=1862386 RepID=A0A437PRI1_9BACT|nr:DUF4954 family protein [Sandaracinomonas limnophila]RVU24857.1 DUF4954 family protein [Sandaracinomonas limnophila]